MALVRWLNGIERPIFATAKLSAAHPAAAMYAPIASGLLAVGLSRQPRDYVLWFRPELGSTVRWAGDPAKPKRLDRHGVRLTPRGSFAEWLEVTRMQSAPWSHGDLEAAERLRVVFLESVLQSVDFKRQELKFEQARAMAEELERRVAQRTEQLRSVAADLEAVEDRERRQLARDLHDDLGQTLAAARIRLASLVGDERDAVRLTATAVGEMIDNANNAIRSLAAQLAPDVLLHELGISPALDWLGEEIEHTFGLKVTVLDDGSPKPLAPESRSIIYRAVRELLINVAKHAHTGSAVIEAKGEAGLIVVSVSDRGAGYDADGSAGGRRGLGLISVRERLSRIGGSANFRSAPGSGTTAILTAPLLNPAPAGQGRGP
jgi:signal transduction histidine kinase